MTGKVCFGSLYLVLEVPANPSKGPDFNQHPIPFMPSIASYPAPGNLLVIATGISALIRLHLHTLYHNRLTTLTRNPNRSTASSHTARNLKEVILRALRLAPRTTTVSRNFQLRSTTVGIDDLRREPVFRNARFGVNGKRPRDLRALDELVRGVDDAFGLVGEGFEGVLEEVEVAFVAFGTLVDDLFTFIEISNLVSIGSLDISYHSP